ncbi:MAG: protein-glutamate O-methyltransferase CheR, partial [Desulfotomaculaceae bacterium]|nr:protein-glutamate O-methyltransferase CheR [Desulfotomaculaceae bacterium]
SGSFGSFKEYYDYVVKDHSGRALLDLVDRISTNHTFFFREKDHFDYLSAVVLPEISETLRRKQRCDVRIWSAGCSSGEEPYSLAMVASEYYGDRILGADLGILATDISISALEKATAGIYPEESMSTVSLAYRHKYFTRLKDGAWAVKKSLKDMVLFRRLNLIQQSYPFKGMFQVIFCRNVMIYFDKVTQKALVERFYRYTEPGGYLFIGHSETLDRGAGLYRFVQPSVYKKE